MPLLARPYATALLFTCLGLCLGGAKTNAVEPSASRLADLQLLHNLITTPASSPMGTDVLPRLLALSRDDEPAVRTAAFEALTAVPSLHLAARTRLYAALEDEDYQIRRLAIRALAPHETSPRLLMTLLEDTHPLVAGEGLMALAPWSGDPLILMHLKSIANGPPSLLAQMARQLVADASSSNVVPTPQSLRSPGHREMAARMLSGLVAAEGASRSLTTRETQSLVSFLEDPHPNVRTAALEGLYGLALSLKKDQQLRYRFSPPLRMGLLVNLSHTHPETYRIARRTGALLTSFPEIRERLWDTVDEHTTLEKSLFNLSLLAPQLADHPERFIPAVLILDRASRSPSAALRTRGLITLRILARQPGLHSFFAMGLESCSQKTDPLFLSAWLTGLLHSAPLSGVRGSAQDILTTTLQSWEQRAQLAPADPEHLSAGDLDTIFASLPAPQRSDLVTWASDLHHVTMALFHRDPCGAWLEPTPQK